MRDIQGDWRVPPIWRGETAFLLGGGPSLAQTDLTTLPARGRTIAIKHAHALAPWADCLFWADDRWLDWSRPDINAHRAPLKVSTFPAPPPLRDVRFIGSQRRQIGEVGLSHDPRMLGGYDSGSCALNLAFLLGARRIVLLGFDMHGGHWHDQRAESGDGARHQMHAAFAKMASPLRASGCEVINATPASALTAFSRMTIDALG